MLQPWRLHGQYRLHRMGAFKFVAEVPDHRGAITRRWSGLLGALWRTCYAWTPAATSTWSGVISYPSSRAVSTASCFSAASPLSATCWSMGRLITSSPTKIRTSQRFLPEFQSTLARSARNIAGLPSLPVYGGLPGKQEGLTMDSGSY